MKVRPGDRSFETVLHRRISRIKAASVAIATLNVGFVLILVMQSTLLSESISIEISYSADQSLHLHAKPEYSSSALSQPVNQRVSRLYFIFSTFHRQTHLHPPLHPRPQNRPRKQTTRRKYEHYNHRFIFPRISLYHPPISQSQIPPRKSTAAELQGERHTKTSRNNILLLRTLTLGQIIIQTKCAIAIITRQRPIAARCLFVFVLLIIIFRVFARVDFGGSVVVEIPSWFCSSL
ncbi:hypothetical protein TCE0_038f12356 [Talaromyces pinophilus]|uniref:Uncharacterized protein n=1 Tax=Talaromyces pinophilus TaxID=128442 RepID=A0A0B8MYD2_TALPI|nr:hypothetical protein TCE0_038f12356 [Talaromyces pinophilus]